MSYSAVHYGADFIGYALRSVYDHVAQAHILYTHNPSHGHQTDAPPVESMIDILYAATTYDPEQKLRWYEVNNIYFEGRQRDMAVETCRQAGANMVLVIDCDEVWHPDVLQKALNFAWSENRARNWLINFTHLWRSFDWCCRDQGWPVRIIDLRHEGGTGYIPKELGEVFHFGYCIRDKVLRYKMLIHGHKNEFRPDWYDTKWSVWPPPKDCHPTNDQGFWTPEFFNKEKLPDLMKSHPFYNLEIVE